MCGHVAAVNIDETGWALHEQAALKSPKTKRHRIFANNLLKRRPALWTFTAAPGVEPTNNQAEPGLGGALV